MERFDEIFTKVSKAITLYIVGALLLASVLYVSANVVGRYLFDSPALGMRSYVGIMLLPITYLALAYGWYKRGYITVDILQNRLKGKVLWGFQFAFLLVTLIFFAGLIGYGAAMETIMSYTMKLQAGRPTYYTPEWPWRAVMALGLFLMMIRNILDLIKMLRTGEVIPLDRQG